MDISLQERRRQMSASQIQPELFFASPTLPKRLTIVVARSEATKQSMLPMPLYGLLRCARNDGLQLRVVDRLMAIERPRDRRQRVFKPCRAIQQPHAINFPHPTVREN